MPLDDFLARKDWIAPRQDRWTDILPESWQTAINTSPTLNALARYMARPSFEEGVKQWQDSIPGNSPIDRIADRKSTLAQEFPQPMNPLGQSLMETGGFLANFIGPGAKMPPAGANSWRFPGARLPKGAEDVPSPVAPTDNGMIRAYHGSPASFDQFVTPAFFAREELMAQAYKKQGGGDNLNGMWKPNASGSDGHMYEVRIPKPTKNFGDFINLEDQAALLAQAKRDGHKVVAFGNPKQEFSQELIALDPAVITILRRYGLMPPIVAGAAAADQLINGEGGSGPAIAAGTRPGLASLIPKAPLQGTNNWRFPSASIPERAPEIPAVPTTQGIRAYHGSPHDFDRFDISKIGTGEGAQAYGRGLYFAEAEGTARSYRDALGAPAPAWGLAKDGRYFPADGASYWGIQRLNEKLAEKLPYGSTESLSHADVLRAYEAIKRDADAIKGPNGEKLRRELDGVGQLIASNPDLTFMRKPPTGRLYEVRINADPETFLDWDKPLSQQPEAVRKAIEGAIGEKANDPLFRRMFLDQGKAQDAYGAVVNIKGDAEKGAAALRDAGIPGIKYKDQMSRGTDGGTSNYVVFDAALIEILRKYGLLPPVAAGAAQALSQGQDTAY